MPDGAVRASNGTTNDLWIPVPLASINALPKKHHSVYIALENIMLFTVLQNQPSQFKPTHDSKAISIYIQANSS